MLAITDLFLIFSVIAVIVRYLKFRHSRRRLYELAETLPGVSESRLPLIGHAHLLIGNTQGIYDIVSKFSKYCNENNGIFNTWLGPLHYIFMTNPEDIEIILNTCLKKDSTYNYMKPWLGEGLISSQVCLWKRHRKALTPTFGQKILDSFIDIFNEHAKKVVKKLERMPNDKTFDAIKFIGPCTLDMIFATAMGVTTNSQDDDDFPYFKASKSQMDVSFQRMVKIWLHPDILYYMSPQGIQERKNLQILHTFTQEVIDKKKQDFNTSKSRNKDVKEKIEFQTGDILLKPKTKPKALLDHMIELSENGGNWTDVELRNEVDTISIAGYDTSAQSVSFVLTILGIYPKIQEKVYKELQNIFGDSNRAVNKEDLPKMVYLEMVIKETLRLFPVAPIIVRKTEKEVKLGKYVIPADTGCIISIVGVHRRPDIWGHDCEEFNPDRFLPENNFGKHTYSYIPFSAGSRNCIGKQYAWMSMKVLLSTILRHYKISSDLDMKTIPLKLEVVLKPMNGFLVRVQKR